MVDALELGRQSQLFDLWAFVIMPEHVHAIVYPHEDVRMQQILKTLKQSVAIRARNWLTDNAPQYLQKLSRSDATGRHAFQFWQRGGGYDRNLRSANDVHEKIAYIHANPVRRGLATKPSEWKWSSCRAWETGEDTPLAIDRHSVPRLYG
jgi:putative transposase